MNIYANYREDAAPTAEALTETNRSKDSLQITIVDLIESFGMIQIDQRPTHAYFLNYPVYDEAHGDVYFHAVWRMFAPCRPVSRWQVPTSRLVPEPKISNLL